MIRGKPTKTTGLIKYIIRSLKRIAQLIFWGFIVYLMIAFVIWAGKKVFYWAIGS